MAKKLFLTIMLVCSTLFVSAQTTVYRVNKASTQTEDGLTWDSGFKTIGAALAAAGDASPTVIEIWVKADTYQEAHFWLRNNVHIFGGFLGTETNRDDRNWQNNATILKPSAAGQRIIIRHSGTSVKNGVLDGFTLTGADGIWTAYLNAGNIVRNCTFKDNNSGTYNGGAIYLGSGSTLENCVVKDNISGGSGGGVAGGHAQQKDMPIKIINCEIVNNVSTGDGGGVYIGSYTLEMYNTLIANNTSGARGGGFRFETPPQQSKITNCTVVNNESGSEKEGGMYLSTINGEVVYVTNTIMYGNREAGGNVSNVNVNENVSISYTGIEELPVELNGNNNINLTANQFVSPTAFSGKIIPSPTYDWSLLSTSDCVNAGDNSAVSGTVDLAGNDRIQKGTVDLGAYESPHGVSVGSDKEEFFVSGSAYFNSMGRSFVFPDKASNVEVYNLQGVKVFEATELVGNVSADFVKTGVYILKYRANDSLFQQKFIVY